MQIFEAAPDDGPSLALHGGAGNRVEELTLEGRAAYSDGLTAAYRAGWQVLAAGGSALDAVCASVEALENNPLFNAGRGAALTATGHAELDASVMTGAGRAGAVAASKHAKNPVLLARAVMEQTEHALIVDPDVAFVDRHGFQPVERGYFITPTRRQQLERVLDGRAAAARHGTVGAVARDTLGRVAAATSTGGMVGQVARIRYAQADLATAVRETIEAELGRRGSTGGVIAVGGDGRIVVAHNSPAMFSARGTGPEPTITT
jgi:beta-aspartyl-peptidase (threonine type)